MKRILIGTALLIFLNLYAIAQITIGSNTSPASGALLDLKEWDSLSDNSSKGVMLPRVNLAKKNGLTPCIDETLYPNERDKHLGLTVYNLAHETAENLCPGIYVWDGNIWQRLYGSCVAATVSNLASDYIMDGQEHSFTLNSLDDWEATTVDSDHILVSTSTLRGNKGEKEFKFTLPVKLDTDATATITFSNKTDPSIKTAATVYGKKMTFNVPEDFAIEISANTVKFPFVFSSNSTLPMTIIDKPSWLLFDAVKQSMTIPGNAVVIVGVYPIVITNRAFTKTVYIELKPRQVEGPDPIDPTE